ncbi:hypothetical protein DL93DRAFT_377710 [Clavulina sp. PMI_390]|nr:hypothetical protein DL93DRAFT_377710 [Clavulina sp. PMI_390]
MSPALDSFPLIHHRRASQCRARLFPLFFLFLIVIDTRGVLATARHTGGPRHCQAYLYEQTCLHIRSRCFTISPFFFFSPDGAHFRSTLSSYISCSGLSNVQITARSSIEVD